MGLIIFASGQMGDGEDSSTSRGGSSVLFPPPITQVGGIAYSSRDGSFGVLDDQDHDVLMGAKAIPLYYGNHKGFLITKEGAGISSPTSRWANPPRFFRSTSAGSRTPLPGSGHASRQVILFKPPSSKVLG